MENMPAQIDVSYTSSEAMLLAYKKHVLHTGKRPASVYAFMQQNGLDESVFYDEYNSFEALEQQIWASYLHTTITRLDQDSTYQSYSAREQFLALFYTLFEVLKKERSFVLWTMQNNAKMQFLSAFKDKYFVFVNNILADGKAEGHIQHRPFISDKYASVLWQQFKLILQFWVKDNSKSFEQTDAAIEKSANVVFDLLGRTFADSGLDFIKFVWQQKNMSR